MAIVGPGAVQDNLIAPEPALDGASEYEYITILNPLTDDFAVRVAQDVPVNMPFNIGKDTSGQVNQVTNTEQDARQVYGLNLKNPDFKSRKTIYNDTIIPAGTTINLKGNEAQVAVRQLVNEILQREGKSRQLADPHTRKEVEERIIQRRGSIQELMDTNLLSQKQQLDAAINQSNANMPAPQPQEVATAATAPQTMPEQPRRVGRPKKTDA